MLTMHARWLFFLFACVSLCTGYLVYFFGRVGPAIYAIPENLEPWVIPLPLLSEISGSLPSFFHTIAFILLIAVVANPSRAGLILICSGWMIVELFFEIGQHPAFAPILTESIPLWFADYPFLEVADSYFLTGTFDSVDVLFILVGTASAFLAVFKVMRWEAHHV